MLLGAYRPVEMSLSGNPLRAIKQELRMRKQCAELPLEFLSEAMVAEYLAARCPDSQLPARLARMIHRRADGNPFFMVKAEMYRLKGELLLRIEDRGSRIEDRDTPSSILGPQSSPEECFRQAIVIARRQGAKSWELRAVASLSRLRQRQGKREEALGPLAGIYGWFTEGFDTADLQEARALLVEMS